MNSFRQSIVGQPEHPVLLQRPAILTSAFIWTMMTFVVGGITWAAVAQIDQSVPAAGKLEPKDSVTEVKAPTGGVVQEVVVKDGERVEAGDLLVRFDPTGPEADVESLRATQQALALEGRILRSEASGGTSPLSTRADIADLKRNIQVRLAENQYYQALLNGQNAPAPSQQSRLVQNLAAHLAQLSTLRAQVAQLSAQANELQQNKQNFQAQRVSLEERRRQSQQRLEINEGIVADLEPLVEAGAVARLQYKQQQQQVLNNSESVTALDGQIASLIEQEQAVQASIAAKQAEIAAKQEEIRSASFQWRADLENRIAANEQAIGDIKSQLAQSDLQNRRQAAQVEGDIIKARQQVQYRELRAPVSGTVFNIKAGGEGAVVNPSEAILSIVPDGDLVASVYVTNKDIGFITPGMPVDVNIDSFPALEFGSIEGTLTKIGSDVLPPDPQEGRQTYTFPLTIELDSQSLQTKNGVEFDIQSGMSVSARIKTRKRSVLDIFLGQFKSRVDSFETVR
jgi:HlyD family secretion protein